MDDRETTKLRIKEAINLAEFIGRDRELKRAGEREWKGLCPFHNDTDPSFTVFFKEGWAFHCFACGASGDIFEWIMRWQGVEFPQALKVAANYAGISLPDSRERIYQPREVRESAEPVRGVLEAEKYKALTEGSAACRYLTETRGLELHFLTDYSVGETVDGLAYAFAYKWQPPNYRKVFTEFCKVVEIERPGGKKVERRDPKGGKSILFGMCAPMVQKALEEGGELVIAEGEIDAISWAQYGYAAVSVPGGAKALGWIDRCWDWLQPFRKIHIAFDEDEAGRGKVVEIVTRLGMARTDIIRLPEKTVPAPENGVRVVTRYKDINECLQDGVPCEVIMESMIEPEILKPERLKNIYEFEEEIWQKFHPSGKDQVGLTLPWGNYHGSSLPFRFRYREVTLWTGYNKHGKSEVLNHVVVNLCWQDDKALICSLEVQAPETYRKLIRMTQARRNVCEPEERAQFRERCLKPLAQKIWVYDAVGNANIEDVLAVMLYAYQRFGCRQFVLDSLMRFSGLDGEGQDIWNAQKAFMDRLVDFARTYNVHMHLVAHSKKPSDRRGEANIPRRYDVMGSSYLTNLAFNVIVVWRNRGKQDKLEEIFQACADLWVKKNPERTMPPWKRLMSGKPHPNAPVEMRDTWDSMIEIVKEFGTEKEQEFLELVKEHDSYFIVDAQRGGDGDCPARRLWFHYDSLQFLEVSPWNEHDPRRNPTVYAAQKVEEMDEEL